MGKAILDGSATQHELSWPESPGTVGYAIQGDVRLQPIVWNLKKQEDIIGNWLKYDYYQIDEKLSVRKWTSALGYTKECYLQKVTSSIGSEIQFILEDKGVGEFDGEYWDSYGDNEGLNSSPDGFVDPFERKFLSAIEIRGSTKELIGKIEFCYKALKVNPGGIKRPGFTKRLLTSVIHTNADGIQIDHEDYDYYTDAEKASQVTALGKLKEPLGALYRINGANCGSVEFQYSNQSLGSIGITSHTQDLDLVTQPLVGSLDDGTRFVVDISKDFKGLKILGLIGGKWVNMPADITKYISSYPDFGGTASLLMGDKGWFAIVENGTGSYEGVKNLIPVVWNGKKWEAITNIRGGGSREAVWAGPDYLVHTRAANNKIYLTIPWTRWGKTYQYTINNVDDSQYDRTQILIEAGVKHIVVSYIRNDLAPSNSRALAVLSFTGKDLIETFFDKDLDNSNQYFLAGDLFLGLEESRGLTGFYASAWHWKGNGWQKSLNRTKLNGVQGDLSLMARGANYFLVRHNDDDDMTLFDWDGQDWSRPYKNKNMVDGDDFDLFVESNWHADGGNDFFVIRHPRLDWIYQRVCWLARPKMWGMKCVRHVNVPVWKFTNRDAKLTRFENREDSWSHTDETTLGCPNTEKNVLTGQDWYIESSCAKKAWIWNDQSWHEEEIPESALTDAKSLGNNLYISKGAIYQKIDDSFLSAFGAFVVSKKTVSDPVTDQTNEFNYSFTYVNQNSGFAFDGSNNTPLVESISIQLPNNAGFVKQTLCPIISGENLRLAMGQVCKEEKLSATGQLLNWTQSEFKRHWEENWPSSVYLDRLVSTKGVVNGLKQQSVVNYDFALNGLANSTIQLVGNKKTEVRTLYAATHYSELAEANRLVEVSGSYSCTPDCSVGKVVNGTASRYGSAIGTPVPSVIEKWSWMPSTIQPAGNFTFNWESSNQSNYWKKIETVTQYKNGFIAETENILGIKTARFNDNSEFNLNYGQVSGGGINQSLLVSGQSCQIPNITTCSLYEFNGYAVDGNNIANGRFSKSAIQINASTPLAGALPSSIGEKYQFSAWIQNVDAVDRELQLTISGNIVKRWTISGANSGQWTQIDWNGNIPAGKVIFAISAQSPMRIQDLRLLPYNASASIKYWDRKWGQIIAESNEKGHGTFVKLDAAGRVIERYAEDVNGSIYLSSRTQYSTAACKVNSNGAGTLSNIKINGETVVLPSINGLQTIILPGGQTEFNAIWEVKQKGDHVRYQFYPAGAEATAEWFSACCSDIESISGDLSANKSWILKLDVEPYSTSNEADYTINIQKDATGWTDHGGPIGIGGGTLGRYLNDQIVDRVSYVSQASSKLLREAVFDGNNWVSSQVYDGSVDEYVSTSNQSSQYIMNIPSTADDFESTESANALVGRMNSWSSMGSLSLQKGVDMLRVALDANSTPWVIYRNANIGGALQAVKWDAPNSKWDQIGFLPVFTSDDAGPSNYLSGQISDRQTLDADIALGPDGNMYVAYIGAVNALGNENASPKVVVIKRFFSSLESQVDKDVWSGPSLLSEELGLSQKQMPNYAGDVLELDDQILIGAKRIKLKSDGSDLYLAVAYEAEETPSLLQSLTVFKLICENQITGEEGVVFSKKYTFQPILDHSITKPLYGENADKEQERIVYLKPSDPFDFVVRQGTPYISFSNVQNLQRLTVVKYDGNRWLSIGSPAFAYPSNKAEQVDLATSGENEPYVIFQESVNSPNVNRRNRVVPLKYVQQGDRDLTLASVVVGDDLSRIASEFRQYILNYSAKIDANITSIPIQVIPQTINDIVGIQIENNDDLLTSSIIMRHN